MKKAFYLIPLLLLAISATHFSLYKDTVNYNPSGDLKSLKPSHWKIMDFQLNASFSLSQASASGSSSTNSTKPYSDGAKFNGFPFGFYFVKSESTTIYQYSVSAYSWLWASVDILIVVLGLLVAFLFNRKRNFQTELPPTDFQQPSAPQPPIYPEVPSQPMDGSNLPTG